MKDNLIDHLSYSQVNTYAQCPRRWYYEKVKYKIYKKAWPLTLGSAYHACLEAMYKGTEINEALQIFGDGLKKWGALTDYEKGDAEQMLGNIRYYYYNVYPKYKSLYEVAEKEIEVVIDKVDVPIIGMVDVITKDARIIDHKTVGRTEPKAEQNTQMLLYAYWYYKEYGKMPRKMELHKSFKYTKGKRDPVVIDTARVDWPDICRVVEMVQGVWQGIKNEQFHPMPNEFCKWCQYQEHCAKASVSKIL